MSLLLVSSLIATGTLALQASFTAALGGRRLIRPGAATCIYEGKKLAGIRVVPPEARSLPGRRRTFAKWQAVLQRRSESGRWRRIASTDFDPPFTTLNGRRFKRLAPRQKFAASLPSSGFLRVKVEVRWSASSGAVIGRRSTLTENYKGSPSRGCLSQKPVAAGVGSPLWWGNFDRTALHSGATNVRTERGLVPVVGDFDADHKDDILWYDADGAETFWWGAGRTFERTSSPVLVGAGYSPLSGDFDADGLDDIYWYRPGPSNDLLWWGSSGRAFEVSTISDASGLYDQVVSGDFNGDGFDDIYFYRHPDKTKACEFTGAQYYWWGRSGRGDLEEGGTTDTRECYYKLFIGDVDGDQTDDMLQYGQSPNPRDLMTFYDATNETFRFDQPYGFRPVLGNFDGDLRDDIFWFSPSGDDSQWWGPADRSEFLSSHRTSLKINGDYFPVSGDFDGDSKDDILWYAR